MKIVETLKQEFPDRFEASEVEEFHTSEGVELFFCGAVLEPTDVWTNYEVMEWEDPEIVTERVVREMFNTSKKKIVDISFKPRFTKSGVSGTLTITTRF